MRAGTASRTASSLHHADDWLTVYQGDARAVLAELPERSVHCVVTSPPYWGLRDYGLPPSVWGGDGHAHEWGPEAGRKRSAPDTASGLAGTPRPGNDYDASLGAFCSCGAWRGSLGLEPTPELYVEHMVEVFREVKRVLRDDGTLWLNLGDSYANDTKWGGSTGGKHVAELHGQTGIGRQRVTTGLKAKDLVGLPWRVAFALQADGWYLRSDIIWAKPNPMPESVTDRPTKSHEYLFLLAKSARYYFDAEAVREEGMGRLDRSPQSKGRLGSGGGQFTKGAPPLTEANGRNLRSVWNIATQPYPGAHFATFPEALVEPCIKAGTSERGVCPECGAPWVRVVEPSEEYAAQLGQGAMYRYVKDGPSGPGILTGASTPNRSTTPDYRTTGWRPSCAHETQPVPATCLDPFAGSGTTGLVAQRLSRRAVLIDLSTDYMAQLMHRNRAVPLGI